MCTHKPLRTALGAVTLICALASTACGSPGGAGSDSQPSPSPSPAQASAEAPSAPDTSGSTPAEGQRALSDSSLVLPPACAELTLEDPGSQVSFEGGQATGTRSSATITLRSVTEAVLGGQDVDVAVLTCASADGQSYDSLGVYDDGHELLGAFEQWAAPWTPLPATLEGYSITSVSVEGDSLSLEVPDVGVLGDDAAATSPRSGTAKLGLRWTGSGLEVSRTLFQTSAGEVAVPDPQEVQSFFDAVANEQDEVAAAHADPDTVAWFSTGCLGACDTPLARDTGAVRPLLFPRGAQVSSCQLLGPLAPKETTMLLPGDVGADGAIGTLSNFAPGDVVKPGSFACGIDTTGVEAPVPSSRSEGYTIWLVLEPTADPKSFMLKMVGRSFS